MTDTLYLSPKVAAEIVGCHEDTLKKWAAEGTIPATRTPAGWWRFKRDDLTPFIGLIGRTEPPTEPEAAAS